MSTHAQTQTTFEQYNSYPLRGTEVYTVAQAYIASGQRDDYILHKLIIEHKDEIIYDIALTNQTYIASKLGISQAQVSLLNKILKAL